MTLPSLPAAIFSRIMKSLALIAAAAFLPFTLSAADNAAPGVGNLKKLLQQGLFEEEANRDTAKAAAAYADLVAAYDTQRAFAATALYRLAEIRAKEGNKAEAITLHQRLLAEFPKDEVFAKRSRERLAELGGTLPAAVADAEAPTEAEAKELVQLREMVKNSPDLLNAAGGPENITPLVKAAKNGWLAAASFLLDHGADPNRGGGPVLR
ncbi:MAG: tetratricopeptide repeat protein, partial [Verrucomicrobiaceae bacterium]